MSYLDTLGAGRAKTIDDPSLDITGDIELMAAVRSDDYSPIFDQTLFRKWNSGADERSWDWFFTNTGQLGLSWSPDGTGPAQENEFSVDTIQVEAGISDGDDVWVRTTLNVSNPFEVRYYYSNDSIGTPVSSVAWTEFAELRTGAAATSIHSGTFGIDVGANGGNGETLDGRIYTIAVYDGIGGTEVANPDWRSTTQGDWNAAGPAVDDDHGREWNFLGTADWIDDGRPPKARHIVTPRQSLHRRQHQVFT